LRVLAAPSNNIQAAVQTSDGVTLSNPNWAVRLLPSLTDIIFLFPVLLLFSLSRGVRTLLDDGDLGWHIRTGEWIRQHHTVPTTDLFSFTKPGAPWFAWEWLWDTIFAAIHRSFGLTAVVGVHVLLLGVVSVLTFRLTRRQCGNDLVAFGLTTIAMISSTLHWLARPHLLSWVFFLVFAHLLTLAGEGRTKYLICLPPLMLVWANVHGSFFMGICCVLIPGLAPWIEHAATGGMRKHALQRSWPSSN
jgi:hypothetical protein